MRKPTRSTDEPAHQEFIDDGDSLFNAVIETIGAANPSPLLKLKEKLKGTAPRLLAIQWSNHEETTRAKSR